MAKSQAEIAAQLNEATAKIQKVGTETRTLITKVQELTDIIANQGNATPELEAAANAVTEQIAVVDELVPDAPTEPEPTEPTL